MFIRLNLSKREQQGVYDSKEARYGAEQAKSIHPGKELSNLIESINEANLNELETAIAEIKQTDIVREPIGWRISAETNKKLEDLAVRVRATKSDVIRGIIYLRARELKTSKEDINFSVAAWVVNNGDVIPVNLIVKEIMKTNADLIVLSNYNRASLGRTDLKTFFKEQSYEIYESRYDPEKRGFLVLYNGRRFNLISEASGGQDAFLPICFKDQNTKKDVVLIAVKVPYKGKNGEEVKVEETLHKLDELVVDLQQKIKNAEFIVAGDFRALPYKFLEYKVLQSLSICHTHGSEWSHVLKNGDYLGKRLIDHIFISSGLQLIGNSEYRWDFLEEECYHGLTAGDHIETHGLPNHALVRVQVKYKDR